MRFNISCSVLIPANGQRLVYVSIPPKLTTNLLKIVKRFSVLEDMKFLCRKFCPGEVEKVETRLKVANGSILDTTQVNEVKQKELKEENLEDDEARF